MKAKDVTEPEVPVAGKEVTFKVKKSTLGRIGWRIMPEDDSLNMKMNQEILNQVLEKIRFSKSPE